jgi:hypothetical protein
MSFHNFLKTKIGVDLYERLESAAEKEVAVIMRKPLEDENGKDNFYTPPFLLDEFLSEWERFEKSGLGILPVDVLSTLFRCKLLFAVKSQREFGQRGGGGWSGSFAVSLRWEDRANGIEAVIDQYIEGLQGEIETRTLLAGITCFASSASDGERQQLFFEDLFGSLNLPFVCFLAVPSLIEKHKQLRPSLVSYEQKAAEEFFNAPSFGYTVSGTRNYCLWNGSMWLRSFLNMLRIGGYIHPGQRDFGTGITIEPPTFPVFLGEYSIGSFQWKEDSKEARRKHPDGCLYRSFGFRGLSKMRLDDRSFGGIKKFVLEHKGILEHLKNPGSQKNLQDVAPTLDILSSATQAQDLGTKILLVYCCLEHLFVPEKARNSKSKYIIGGLNALNRQLVPWFEELYKQRNDYAHKGFVLTNDKTRSLVHESMKNVMALLCLKLQASKQGPI